MSEFLNKEGLNTLWNKIDKQNTEVVKRVKKLIDDYDNISIPIYYDTTANWTKKTDLVSVEGSIYIYSDYQKDSDDNIAGIKIGDGKAYVVDLPFIDTLYLKHIENSIIHITDQERTKWNGKVSCEISLSDEENLVFKTS